MSLTTGHFKPNLATEENHEQEWNKINAKFTLSPEAHCYPAPSCLAAGRSQGAWSAARLVIGRRQGPDFQWTGLAVVLNSGIGQRDAWNPGTG